MSFFRNHLPILYPCYERLDKIVSFSYHNIENPSKLLVNTNLLLLAAVLAGTGTLLFLLFYWFRTIAIYAEDENGKINYLERLWIIYKEEHFEVRIPDSLLERCVTTHLCIKPDILFTEFNSGKNICFLLLDGICISRKVEQNMDILIL